MRHQSAIRQHAGEQSRAVLRHVVERQPHSPFSARRRPTVSSRDNRP